MQLKMTLCGCEAKWRTANTFAISRYKEPSRRMAPSNPRSETSADNVARCKSCKLCRLAITQPPWTDGPGARKLQDLCSEAAPGVRYGERVSVFLRSNSGRFAGSVPEYGPLSGG